MKYVYAIQNRNVRREFPAIVLQHTWLCIYIENARILFCQIG